MPRISRFWYLVPVTVLIAVGSFVWARSVAPTWTGPAFGPDFSSHWHDGNAEIAGYELTYPRYGQLRSGTAVAIFVSEPHQPSTGIKPERPAADSVPAFKLNLVEDFPTGIYDYNMMTSAFVSTQPVAGRPAGSILKTSFSAAEWCGHAYQQVRFGSDAAHLVSHSYFEGEADTDRSEAYPAHGIAEDALLLWARGLAGPPLEPGASINLPILRASALARLTHLPVAWDTAALKRAASPQTVTVPAGTFQVDVYTAKVTMDATRHTYPIPGRSSPRSTRTWTFYVESAHPHRVIKWERSDGINAELMGDKRLPYWSLNANAHEKLLTEIGLSPRPSRTP